MRRTLRCFSDLLRCGIIPFVLFLSLSGPTSARQLGFEQVGNIVSSKSCAPVDLDGDGTDEIVTVVDNHAYVYAWRGVQLVMLKQLAHDRGPALLWAGSGDVDGVRGSEFVLERLYPDSMDLEVYGLHAGAVAMEQRLSLGRVEVGGVGTVLGPYHWDAAALLMGAIARNPDGRRTIVFAFNTGYSLQPRGLIAFDAASGSVAWNRLIGPCPQSPPVAVWADDASRARFVLAGSSWGNQAIGSGVPDSVAGVFVVDGLGKLVWWRKTDGNHTSLNHAVADFNGDGRVEIVVAGRHQEMLVNAPSMLRVLALDDGHVLRERRVSANVAAVQAGDLNLDGRCEILVLSEDGRLSAYDYDLDSLASSSARVTDSPILVAGNLVGDPRPEILVGSRNGGELAIYDASLHLVGAFSPPGSPIRSAAVLRVASGHPLLVVEASDVLRLVRPSWIRDPWRSTASLIGLWLGIIGIGALVLTAARRWQSGEIARGRIRALVSDLRIIRHGVRAGDEKPEPLVRLRRGLRTCTEPGGFDAGRVTLRDSEATYRSYVHPTLKRIQETAAFVLPGRLTLSLWLTVRRATSDLDDLFGRLEEADREVPLFLRAERSLQALDGKLRQVEASALSRIQSDPLGEANAACEALRPMMKQAGVLLEGFEVAGEPGAKVFIDGMELRQILHGLLLNAIESCRDASEPRLGIDIACGERRVVVRVRDNGRGVPPQDAEAIFHGKSTKTPPGGAGLQHARRVVDSYSGIVILRESTPWERTTFEVELCRVPS